MSYRLIERARNFGAEKPIVIDAHAVAHLKREFIIMWKLSLIVILPACELQLVNGDHEEESEMNPLAPVTSV